MDPISILSFARRLVCYGGLEFSLGGMSMTMIATARLRHNMYENHLYVSLLLLKDLSFFHFNSHALVSSWPLLLLRENRTLNEVGGQTR